MPRPRLSTAVSWTRFENTVHALFIEVLRRLAKYKRLAAAEEPINLEVYWLALKVHS